MALYERLSADDSTNINTNSFTACVRQIQRGLMNVAEASAVLGLDDAESKELDALLPGLSAKDHGFLWDVIYLSKRKADGYATGSELESQLKR